MDTSAVMRVLYVYVLSLLPSFEARYAVVAGSLLGVELPLSLAASLLGIATLSLILPLVLPYVDKLAEKLSRSHLGVLSRAGRLYLYYVERVRRKAAKYTEKYGFIGLIAFVAIPLPGTGIWTGGIAAHILAIPRHKTIIALLLGGLISLAITATPLYASQFLHQ